MTQFCLVSTSNGFGANESREVSLKGNMQDVSVNYNVIDKSDILNIYMYLMVESNIKQCPSLLNQFLLDY